MPTEPQHQHQDGDPPSQPLPPIGSPPSPSYASKAAGTRITHKLKHYPVFTDPEEGHLAAAAGAPKGARLGDLVNPKAIAYIIPRTISSGTFSDAVRSTHSALFKTHEDMAPLPILSNMTYPCGDGTNHRIEIVYHESLDATSVSTTPITLDGTQYAPLSSTVSHIITRFIFMDYQFHTSLDFGVQLEQFCSWYFEDFKEMGKVIKIEIPLFPTPNGNYEARSQFAVYVKSDKTADDCRIDRLLPMGSRQKAPCRISWMGATPFCNYCKGYGHLIPQCPKRLAIVCSACNANGHVSFTCSRFSARDTKGAKGKMTVRGQPTATPFIESSPPSSDASSSATSSSDPSSSCTTTISSTSSLASSPSSDFTHSPSSSTHLPDDSAQHGVTSNIVQPVLNTTSVTPLSQVVDLMGEEFPSNSSKYDITMTEDQGQGQASQEMDFEGDISLTEADLEDLDRDANNIANKQDNPLPTNPSNDNDEHMEEAAYASPVAPRTKVARTGVRSPPASTAKTITKASNSACTKGSRYATRSTTKSPASPIKNDQT
ncbi:MAG: hypothetical protein J3R72DRAFT_498512 [Linnemannia gamsii]|nr:MAG: hypothetical protein J3R72DRAFT_498512 [Linnemannia gamsii]